MEKGSIVQKRFMEEQLEWCRQQDLILVEIEKKLYEMRALAEYARDYELTSLEIDELNVRLQQIKSEVTSLEQQLQSIVH